MKRQFVYILLLLVGMLSACKGGENSPVVNPPVPGGDTVTAGYSLPALDQMTLREKVGQMFNIRPEKLSSTAATTTGNKAMRDAFAQYPVGGFTLFAKNINSPAQLREFTTFLHSLGNYPLLCIDEEGGVVARIGKNSSFDVPHYDNMYSIGQTGDTLNAFEAGSAIGTYLLEYGLDVDFAPVADVWSNPNNTVIGKRSFGNDPQLVAGMSMSFSNGLATHQVVSCFKHFPGHGDTDKDTHYGYAEVTLSWEEMQQRELIPFSNAINHGAAMIMAAHISCPKVTGESMPATTSYTLLTEKLRGEMGFEGIIITDGMEMGAITSQYATSGEAAIAAILAGTDIVLLPADYQSAFDAVVTAVESGRISEERINRSVQRILSLKTRVLRQRGLLK